MAFLNVLRRMAITLAAVSLAACSTGRYPAAPAQAGAISDHVYKIGPMDALNVVVWRNPELSSTVTVRPDGRLSLPLAEDLVAAGRTPALHDLGLEAVGARTQHEVLQVATDFAFAAYWLMPRLHRFIDANPTVKMLALSFLLLIGVNLVAEGFGFKIPKGYTYFAMGFSMAVEFLNMRMRRGKTVKLNQPDELSEMH